MLVNSAMLENPQDGNLNCKMVYMFFSAIGVKIRAPKIK